MGERLKIDATNGRDEKRKKEKKKKKTEAAAAAVNTRASVWNFSLDTRRRIQQLAAAQLVVYKGAIDAHALYDDNVSNSFYTTTTTTTPSTVRWYEHRRSDKSVSSSGKINFKKKTSLEYDPGEFFFFLLSSSVIVRARANELRQAAGHDDDDDDARLSPRV